MNIYRSEHRAFARSFDTRAISQIESRSVVATHQVAPFTEQKFIRRKIEGPALVRANVAPGADFPVAMKKHQPLHPIVTFNTQFLAGFSDFRQMAQGCFVIVLINHLLTHPLFGPNYHS